MAKNHSACTGGHTYEETHVCAPLLLCLAAFSVLDLCQWETSTHPKEPWKHKRHQTLHSTKPFAPDVAKTPTHTLPRSNSKLICKIWCAPSGWAWLPGPGWGLAGWAWLAGWGLLAGPGWLCLAGWAWLAGPGWLGQCTWGHEPCSVRS